VSEPRNFFGLRAARPQIGQSSPSILFISHDAARTGAPMALLTFLRWLRANTDYRFEVLLGSGGALEPAFESLAPTTNADVVAGRYLGHLSASVPPVLLNVWRERRLRSLARRLSKADLVYSNTLQNGALLRELWRPGQHVLSHVHELEWWLGYRTSARDLGFTKDVTNHYIVCSRVTAESLVSTQGVPPERITLCHAFVAVDEVELVRARADRHVTRRRLGISPDALVVGGVGTMDWRKGPDLFVQLAAMVIRRLPDADIYFIWAGGDAGGPARGGLLMDARRLGLGDRIKFVGPLEHLAELFAAMDVFALTSREDPFPLVMLEAAAAGVPLVCFAGGGGAPEFALPDAGRVAAYLDVAGMATAVSDLLEHKEERQRMGQKAAERVRNRHTVNQAGPMLMDIIRRSLPPEWGAASPPGLGDDPPPL
jgi:glycosyltransferase involved in cell wall biosynthesis